MIIKVIFTAVVTLFSALSAEAAHSQYSPMAPRQISVEASKADYSYGLTILPGNSIDSLEPVNRFPFWNTNYKVLDRYILRPVAHGYAKLPQFSRDGVHNFFSNVHDLTATFDNALIGEFSDSGVSISRFAINTTLGVAGLFDVASRMGIEQKPMSLDTVFGRYGVDQGEYLMVPGMGPATERSLNAGVIDSWPVYFCTLWPGLVVLAVETVDTRAGLIPQEDVIDSAVDPYAQMRQVYLMYAEGRVNPDAAMENKQDQNVDSYLDEIDE
ncbi:MAG: VacJ family lipoprotein [Succinivibrio sp.]